VADGVTGPPPPAELLVGDIGPLTPGTIWAYCVEGVRNIEAAIASLATVFII
jgi:hypothetical protein